MPKPIPPETLLAMVKKLQRQQRKTDARLNAIESELELEDDDDEDDDDEG